MENNIIKLQKQFIDADPLALLETKVVSAYTGMSIGWFNNKAVYGGGIPYTKMPNKRLYQKKDVLKWLKENSQKVNITAEYKKNKPEVLSEEKNIYTNSVSALFKITRPTQEATEADIGKLCRFWRSNETCCHYGILLGMDKDCSNGKYKMSYSDKYSHCRRLTKQEIDELI